MCSEQIHKSFFYYYQRFFYSFLKKDYLKQVCIYAFNKDELKKFYSRNKKGKLEKIEDIEILRFFEDNIKIKMIRLNSDSVAVDEKKDVKKAEKIIKKLLKKN